MSIKVNIDMPFMSFWCQEGQIGVTMRQIFSLSLSLHTSVLDLAKEKKSVASHFSHSHYYFKIKQLGWINPGIGQAGFDTK